MFAHKRAGALLLGWSTLSLAGCEPRLEAVSAFPGIVCESSSDYSDRRMRVYGSGFQAGMSATFGGAAVSELTVLDDHTLELVLPESIRSPAEYPWYPYLDDGSPGLYDATGEPELWWNVDVEHSAVSDRGQPDPFTLHDDSQLPFEDVALYRIFLGLEDCDGDGEGETAVSLEGDFFLGYFHSGEQQSGVAPNTVGEFTHLPLYYDGQGQPLYFDTSLYQAIREHEAIQAGKTSFCATHAIDGTPNGQEAPPPDNPDCPATWYDVFDSVESLPFVPWDPYVFKGVYLYDKNGDGCEDLTWYDDVASSDTYYPGQLYNQSFGTFFTLHPRFMYMDPASGEILSFPERQESSFEQEYTFLGQDLTSTGHRFHPFILPLSYVDLNLKLGEEEAQLQSRIGVVSRLYDLSILYGADFPYYDFTEYDETTGLPVDGSWQCVWSGF